MSSQIMADIGLFFEDPTTFHDPPRRYSVLYLLRRDIKTCLGINPDTGEKIAYQALLTGTMGILAGIDLLGKFLVGDDKHVGDRFRKFVDSYFAIDAPDDAETIYQLRNALLHSFGLYSEKKNRHGETVKVYRFTLAKVGGVLVCQVNTGYLIDILTLHNQFEIAIESYHADLQTCSSLQTHFAAMFSRYGHIDIGTPQHDSRGDPIATWLVQAMSEQDSVSSV